MANYLATTSVCVREGLLFSCHPLHTYIYISTACDWLNVVFRVLVQSRYACVLKYDLSYIWQTYHPGVTRVRLNHPVAFSERGCAILIAFSFSRSRTVNCCLFFIETEISFFFHDKQIEKYKYASYLFRINIDKLFET